MKKALFFTIILFLFSLSIVKAENECFGSLIFTLSSNVAESGTQIKAITAGLMGKECLGKIIHVRLDSCNGEKACLCTSKGSGCSCYFKAPLPFISSEGLHRWYRSEYVYHACVDKNNDGDYSDEGEDASTTLTVNRGFLTVNLNIFKPLIQLIQSITGRFAQSF
jgi:hypothetical protein